MTTNERLILQAMRAQMVAQIMTIDTILNADAQPEMPTAFVTMGGDDDDSSISILPA
jgi:hypothetical protein